MTHSKIKSSLSDAALKKSSNTEVSELLIKAIENIDVSEINALLFHTPTVEKDINIIVALNNNGDNAILKALQIGIGIVELSGYIFRLNKANLITKKKLEPELIKKIAAAIHEKNFYAHPICVIKDLIKPIYEVESIKMLKDEIGREWLDSYYE